MSGKVTVVAGSSLRTSGGQTQGMARQNAISGMSDQLCGSDPFRYLSGWVLWYGEHLRQMLRTRLAIIYSQADNAVMIAQPHSASGIHHHSNQDTIIYAIRGHGAVISDGGRTRQALGPGDWALIPAGVEHQEVNDGDEEVVWAITRGGKQAAVENVDGWST